MRMHLKDLLCHSLTHSLSQWSRWKFGLYLFVYMSLCLCLYASLSLSTSLCLHLYVSFYMSPSLLLHLYVTISLSVSLYLYLFGSAFMSLSLWFYLYLYLNVTVSISMTLYLKCAFTFGEKWKYGPPLLSKSPHFELWPFFISGADSPLLDFFHFLWHFLFNASLKIFLKVQWYSFLDCFFMSNSRKFIAYNCS